MQRLVDVLGKAAALDGASWWRRVWHVTLPAIRPVIVLLLVLRLGEFLSTGFEQFFLQRQAVGPESGEVLDTFVYYAGFGSGDFGYAAAVGLVRWAATRRPVRAAMGAPSSAKSRT